MEYNKQNIYKADYIYILKMWQLYLSVEAIYPQILFLKEARWLISAVLL